jgi:uncharacterized phiE125 gp8 family phage protein
MYAFPTSIYVVTPPESQVVTAAQLADYLRIIDDDMQETLMNSYIVAATEYIEEKTQHTLQPTQYRYILDRFPYNGRRDNPAMYGPCDGQLYLPRNPVVTIDQFQIVNTDGDNFNLTLGFEYRSDTLSSPARLLPPRLGYWPVIDVATPNAVRVLFTAGYATAIPERAKLAVKFLAAHWYLNREPVTDKAANTVPNTLDSMIRSLRIGYELE